VQHVKYIQRHFNEAWMGVKFYFKNDAVPEVKVGTGLRFCEALVEARSGPLLLVPGAVSCPGADYVFGWDRDHRHGIATKLAERRSMGPEAVEKLISQVPVLKEPPAAIGLNTDDVPDLIISYCQPTTAMNFLKLWQREFGGGNLASDLSSILSVCGNVGVGSYLSKDVSLSFGCDDARQFGGIGRDRLVIGIPYPLIQKLTARNARSERAGVT
jgi:uncharacterized protein (DUF169 family)